MPPAMSSALPISDVLSPSERRLQRFRDFLPKSTRPSTSVATTTIGNGNTDDMKCSNRHTSTGSAIHQNTGTTTGSSNALSPPLQNSTQEYRIVVSPDHVQPQPPPSRPPQRHSTLNTQVNAKIDLYNIRPRSLSHKSPPPSSSQQQQQAPTTMMIEINSSDKENRKPLHPLSYQKCENRNRTEQDDQQHNDSTISSFTDVDGQKDNDFGDQDDSQTLFYSPISIQTMYDVPNTPVGLPTPMYTNTTTGTGSRNTRCSRSAKSHRTTAKTIISPKTILLSSPTTATAPTSPLNYESIQSCTTLSQLIQWRTRLLLLVPDHDEHHYDEPSEHHNRNYPYLLRAIEQRMEQIRSTTGSNPVNSDRNPPMTDQAKTLQPVNVAWKPEDTTSLLHGTTAITPMGYISNNSSEVEMSAKMSKNEITSTAYRMSGLRNPTHSEKVLSASSSSSLVMSISTNDTNNSRNHSATTSMMAVHAANNDLKYDNNVIPDHNEFIGNSISAPTSSKLTSISNVGVIESTEFKRQDDDNVMQQSQQQQQQMMLQVYEQMQQQHSVLSNTVLAEMEKSSIENCYYQQKLFEYMRQRQEPKRKHQPTIFENTVNTDMANSEAMQQLLYSVEQLRNENERLQDHLRKEMSIRQEALQRTKQVREDYSSVLQERDVEYRNLQRTMQETSQQQYEKQLQLQHLLHQTQVKLQSIRTDRKILIETLQSTIRNNKNDVGRMNYDFHAPAASSSISSSDKVDLHRLVLDFKKQQTSQVVTISTMMKVHDESDRMVKNAIEAKCKSENLLIQATHEQRRIMYENQSLLEEIQKLTEQLNASKKEMESYAEMANIERINKYKQTIEELKQQLKQQSQSKHSTNAVPMKLYRSVVVEAKQYSNQVQQQRMVIHTLENQILQLEYERNKNDSLQQRAATTTTTTSNTNRVRAYQPSYPYILNDFFPTMVSNYAPHTASAQNKMDIHHRSSIHSKQPRPKTPLPKISRYNNSPSTKVTEMPTHYEQPKSLIKSALKKKTNEIVHSNTTVSATDGLSNSKAVHFNCIEKTNDKYKKDQRLEASTTPSSSRRNVASSCPTPSCLDYSLTSITPTHQLTNDKVATAVTPNTSGNTRYSKESQMTRSQLRLSAVRAHGGRLGLQEKLRQVRRKHNVDETSLMFSPSLERKTPATGFTSNNSTTETKLPGNNIVASIDTTATTTNAEKENFKKVATSKAAPAELESYNSKLERMRIRPRQVGK